MRRIIAAIVLLICCACAIADRFPVTVTDARGKTVHIASRPERIISLAPSNTEILFALGVGDSVVGVTKRCDYPPAARKIAPVGDVLISTERVVSLRPDLIVAHTTMNPSVIAVMERRGIPVVVVNPESFADLKRDITTIGRAVGASQAAVRMVRHIDDSLADVRAAAKRLGHHPKTLVVIQEWPVWVAGSHTFVNEMIAIAGGENAAADIGWFGQMSMESMVMRSPEVIIVVTGGRADFLHRAATRVTPAVRNGHCISLDPNLFVRPGPRLVDGLRAISRICQDLDHGEHRR